MTVSQPETLVYLTILVSITEQYRIVVRTPGSWTIYHYWHTCHVMVDVWSTLSKAMNNIPLFDVKERNSNFEKLSILMKISRGI